jgi:hypothetical protein
MRMVRPRARMQRCPLRAHGLRRHALHTSPPPRAPQVVRLAKRTDCVHGHHVQCRTMARKKSSTFAAPTDAARNSST